MFGKSIWKNVVVHISGGLKWVIPEKKKHPTLQQIARSFYPFLYQISWPARLLGICCSSILSLVQF